jgi:histidinol-phosphate aminotransferase
VYEQAPVREQAPAHTQPQFKRRLPPRVAVLASVRHNRRVALEFSERIARIPAYPAAGGYAERAPRVRLASNESPWPPLPAVLEAIQGALPTLNRYPDPTNSLLRERLSERYGVPVSRIAIGNGSCDILLAAGETLLEPGAELVYAWPSFSVYPHLSAASGASAITVALDQEDCHDLEAMLREITVATRLVIVCNPNNPTSTALPLADIAGFVAEVPKHVCVIVDEAYCEFNLLEDPDASVELLAHHPNLVLLRTFSKVYGLCGLRVGFALCGSDDLPRAVDQVRQPFFCNVVAQTAAVEALAHQDAVTERVTRTVAERISVDERLRALGIEPAASQANFCWFGLGEQDPEQAAERERQVMCGLTERGVLVRGGGALGRAGALRVTYGTPEENAIFLDALAEVL